MFSERGHDGVERDTEQWFKSLQREGPGKGRGAEIAGVQGRGGNQPLDRLDPAIQILYLPDSLGGYLTDAHRPFDAPLPV